MNAWAQLGPLTVPSLALGGSRILCINTHHSGPPQKKISAQEKNAAILITVVSISGHSYAMTLSYSLFNKNIKATSQGAMLFYGGADVIL